LVVSATLSPGDYVYEVINSTPQQSKWFHSLISSIASTVRSHMSSFPFLPIFLSAIFFHSHHNKEVSIYSQWCMMYTAKAW
jgi:hypothetical protein